MNVHDSHQKHPGISFYIKRSVPAVRLFTFPFAGGGPSIFKDWSEHLSDKIEVLPVHYPGRESRFSEKPTESMEELVAEICESIYPYMDVPFAFLGYSMGGTVAFATASVLQKKGVFSPFKIIVAASGAPGFQKKDQVLHTMSDSDFKKSLAKIGGIPDEILSHPPLLDLFLPVFRADFKILESYIPDKKDRLTTPLVAFMGQKDELYTRNDIENWEKLTVNNFSIEEFSGGHFFINENRPSLLEAVERNLL